MIHHVQEDETTHAEHNQERDKCIPPDPTPGLEEHRAAEGANVLHPAESNRRAVVEVQARYYGAATARAFNSVFGCHYSPPALAGHVCDDAASPLLVSSAYESLTIL